MFQPVLKVVALPTEQQEHSKTETDSLTEDNLTNFTASNRNIHLCRLQSDCLSNPTIITSTLPPATTTTTRPDLSGQNAKAEADDHRSTTQNSSLTSIPSDATPACSREGRCGRTQNAKAQGDGFRASQTSTTTAPTSRNSTSNTPTRGKRNATPKSSREERTQNAKAQGDGLRASQSSTTTRATTSINSTSNTPTRGKRNATPTYTSRRKQRELLLLADKSVLPGVSCTGHYLPLGDRAPTVECRYKAAEDEGHEQGSNATFHLYYSCEAEHSHAQDVDLQHIYESVVACKLEDDREAMFTRNNMRRTSVFLVDFPPLGGVEEWVQMKEALVKMISVSLSTVRQFVCRDTWAFGLLDAAALRHACAREFDLTTPRYAKRSADPDAPCELIDYKGDCIHEGFSRRRNKRSVKIEVSSNSNTTSTLRIYIHKLESAAASVIDCDFFRLVLCLTVMTFLFCACCA